MLAVAVRELSKHQSVSCLIVAFVIARFASLSCYSSAKTMIRPVKLYQINKSFCSITCCASLHLVYHLIAVSTCFRCPELKVRPLSLPCYYFFSSLHPNPNLHLNHFSIFQSHFPIVFLYAILLYSLFRLARACKSHLTFVSFTSYLTNLISLTTVLLLLAK